MSGLTYLGESSLGVYFPLFTPELLAEADANLQTQLSASVALSAGLNVSLPTVGMLLELDAEAVARIQGEIGAALTGPSLNVDLSATLALIEQLNSEISAFLNISSLMASGGVAFMSYGGPASSVGADIASGTDSIWNPTDIVNALILGANSGLSESAIGIMFGQTSPSGFTLIGVESLSVCLPLLGPFVFSVLADLYVKLQLAIGFNLNIGVTLPSVQLSLELALSILAALNADLAVAITPPSISLSVVIEAMVNFQLSLQLYLNILLQLPGLFSTAGIFAWKYSGPSSGFGPALTSALATNWPDGSPSSGSVDMIILGTNVSATAVSIGSLFGLTW